jgi:GNAT superfamily N-acetyltransferase
MTAGSPPSPSGVDSLDRVLEFIRSVLGRTADAMRPIEAGWVASTPSLPAVWGVNQVWVAQPMTFEALVELTDRELAGLPYLHIAVAHQDSGPGLEQAFRAAGWDVERVVIMILSAEPDREVDTSAVIEASSGEVLELMTRWHGEGRELGAAELAQLTEYSRREAEACGDRLLGVRSSDGQLVAITKLRASGSIAQVEDVYTVPEARGRGSARALVTRAVELARHELIFIEADDLDWPKQLYARVGFRPVGRLWQFHRG